MFWPLLLIGLGAPRGGLVTRLSYEHLSKEYAIKGESPQSKLL